MVGINTIKPVDLLAAAAAATDAEALTQLSLAIPLWIGAMSKSTVLMQVIFALDG